MYLDRLIDICTEAVQMTPTTILEDVKYMWVIPAEKNESGNLQSFAFFDIPIISTSPGYADCYRIKLHLRESPPDEHPDRHDINDCLERTHNLGESIVSFISLMNDEHLRLKSYRAFSTHSYSRYDRTFYGWTYTLEFESQGAD